VNPGATHRRAGNPVFLGIYRCELVGRTGFEPVTSSVPGNSEARPGVSVIVGLSRTRSLRPARTFWLRRAVSGAAEYVGSLFWLPPFGPVGRRGAADSCLALITALCCHERPG
jgi:hypothetical protein